MFTRVASPAHPSHYDAAPNTLIDPVVLGLPGALPVLNREAIRMSAMVGLVLGCRIAEFTKWDRKSYYYPDLPKNYQISQYDLPLCFDGTVDVPASEDASDDEPPRRINIVRAHLEEDAGKLMHEWPAGVASTGHSGGAGQARHIDFSIVDYNRAGTPLLEIVTAPDFETAPQVVAFAQMLRNTCRFLGVTEGVMQKGHMRFEPNINMELTLEGGRTVRTPIVEVKNLNSFKSLRGAIEFEAREQPRRWLQDQRELGRGTKVTRGWDDHREETFPQREKEDAHDYRYFPDPDLLPVTITRQWVEELKATLPEPPHSREKRYQTDAALKPKEARALVEDREVCFFYEAAVEAAVALGVPLPTAGKLAANFVLQNGMKRANERAVPVHDLGITAAQIGGLVALRDAGEIGSSAADELFGLLCDSDESPKALAQKHGLLQVKDTAAMQTWCRQVIDNPANAKAVADVQSGKDAAIGRLVGEAMKLSAGQADAKAIREMLITLLRP